ncbi:MAG TPA: carbohydrate kinase family protein [Anaerolineae bacterium]|nr:carbohydrate kinase family protein [Anaerolineae bacterium]
MTSKTIDFVFIGGLREDYCITHEGQVHLGIVGGNAAYSAVGAAVWSASAGIISRVGSTFSRTWLAKLEDAGFDIQGVKILSEPHSNITFYAYLSAEERVDTNPASHFLRIGEKLPKQLLNYRSSTEGQDLRSGYAPLAVRPEDLSNRLKFSRGAHLAPADFLTHVTLPHRLRELGVSLITLDPSERYMQPSFSKDLPGIMRDLDAFLPSETDARALFKPEELDGWEMAEALGAMGCRYVVIKRGARGQLVWDQLAKRRFMVPAYPARVRDVTGAGDAFCGGFLVGLDETGDVVEAALRGNISSSLTIEGTGALYALDAWPGITQARLASLRLSVKKM